MAAGTEGVEQSVKPGRAGSSVEMTMTTRLDSVFLPTGRVLFSEGDAGDHAYLILSGEIEIWIERDG